MIDGGSFRRVLVASPLRDTWGVGCTTACRRTGTDCLARPWRAATTAGLQTRTTRCMADLLLPRGYLVYGRYEDTHEP
eukprot:3410511-Prymnesium_polylepis.1